MKLSEDYTTGSNIIRAFTEDSIEVNDKIFRNSLIVGNTLLIADWGITNIEQITHSHWESFIEYSPEVIIIGTGPAIKFPHPSSYAPIIEQGIGIEFMDSAAACRTYNILLSEDRSVMAGIIL